MRMIVTEHGASSVLVGNGHYAVAHQRSPHQNYSLPHHLEIVGNFMSGIKTTVQIEEIFLLPSLSTHENTKVCNSFTQLGKRTNCILPNISHCITNVNGVKHTSDLSCHLQVSHTISTQSSYIATSYLSSLVSHQGPCESFINQLFLC